MRETTSTPLDVNFKIALLLFLLPITCAEHIATAAPTAAIGVNCADRMASSSGGKLHPRACLNIFISQSLQMCNSVDTHTHTHKCTQTHVSE